MFDNATLDKASKSADTSDLKSDLDAIRKDFAALREDLMKVGSDKARAASASVDEGLTASRQKLEKLMATANEEAHATADTLRKGVRENPIASLSTAVAVGFVIGRVFFRK